MVHQCRHLKARAPKKPGRPPPPPPLPPRPSSNSSSSSRVHLSYTGNESECHSESQQSIGSVPYSTRSQPACCNMPVAHQGYTYNSARSECEYLTQVSSEYSSKYYMTQQSDSPCSCRCSANETLLSNNDRYPASSCYKSLNNSNLTIDNTRPVIRQARQIAPNENTIPVPRQRTTRPRLSISPIPILRKNSDQVRRSRKPCKPLHYKRHIEQNVERLIRYVNERKRRLEQCELEIQSIPDQSTSIRKILTQKETRYLRSLRNPISPKDFEKIANLGAGFMGKVWLVRQIDRMAELSDMDSKPNIYAMKRLNKFKVIEQDHMARVMAERDALAEADNHWIVKLFYSFQDSHHLYFIMEYVPGGDLMNLLLHKGVLSEDWARFYMAEISLALQCVHDMGFIHRDMKPDNILIDVNGHIKLTDFGLCTGNRWTHDLRYYCDDTLTHGLDQNDFGNGNLEEHPTITKGLAQRVLDHERKVKPLSLVGSPNYIAPEVLRQENSNEKLCDWWSAGVILYEMVLGHCPFIDLEKLKRNEYNPMLDPPDHVQMRILNWREYLSFPAPNVSSEAISLMMGLLCDPADRLCQNGIEDIQKHPFFRGIDWLRIRKRDAPYKPMLKDECDTSHFDQSGYFDSEGTIGIAPANRSRDICDFTYRAFWKTTVPDEEE